MYRTLKKRLANIAPPGNLHCNARCCTIDGNPRTLRLVSFNIQVGIRTHAFHHYFTRGWQHLLPHHRRNRTLDEIGRMLREYDIAALQEADGGSLRSGFVNQVQFLAEAAEYPYYYQQLNRNLGKLAQHSNGVLSRIAPSSVREHALPGPIRGRGAIEIRYGQGDASLLIYVLHLSLGSNAQHQQLAFIRDLVGDHPHVVIMGDMNNRLEHLNTHSPLRELNLTSAADTCHTYPSWQPQLALDHILVSPSIDVNWVKVLDFSISDHRPIAMEIGLPEGINLSASTAD